MTGIGLMAGIGLMTEIGLMMGIGLSVHSSSYAAFLGEGLLRCYCTLIEWGFRRRAPLAKNPLWYQWNRSICGYGLGPDFWQQNLLPWIKLIRAWFKRKQDIRSRKPPTSRPLSHN